MNSRGVPIRTRSLAAVGKKTAPRFKAAFIESIGLRAHLKDNGIDTGEAQAVELPAQIFLLASVEFALYWGWYMVFIHAPRNSRLGCKDAESVPFIKIRKLLRVLCGR